MTYKLPKANSYNRSGSETLQDVIATGGIRDEDDVFVTCMSKREKRNRNGDGFVPETGLGRYSTVQRGKRPRFAFSVSPASRG